MAKLLVTQPFNCCYKILVFLNHTNLGGCVFQKVKLQADGASIRLNCHVTHGGHLPWKITHTQGRLMNRRHTSVLPSLGFCGLYA